MSISDQDMEHLKNLARLDIDKEETQELKEDLNKILNAFDQLKTLDTEGIEPLVRPVERQNIFREDRLKESLSHKEALSLAVESEEGFFKVPRTVDLGD